MCFFVLVADRSAARIQAMLSTQNEEYGELPGHFNPNHPAVKALKYQDIVPGYDNYPSGFKQCIPLLIANVVLAADFIITSGHFKENHPIFQTELFQKKIYEQLLPAVLVGHYKCEVTGMEATGVPSTNQLTFEVRNLKQIIKDQQNFFEKLLSKLNFSNGIINAYISTNSDNEIVTSDESSGNFPYIQLTI